MALPGICELVSAYSEPMCVAVGFSYARKTNPSACAPNVVAARIARAAAWRPTRARCAVESEGSMVGSRNAPRGRKTRLQKNRCYASCRVGCIDKQHGFSSFDYLL